MFCTSHFSAFVLPIQYLMTSLVILMTLNHFKTSHMILNKLGTFYMVSLWHVLMFAARGLS